MRYSEQQCFNQCPYRYKLQQDGLKKTEDSKSEHHKMWGQAIHKALELHYQGRPFLEVHDAFLDIYPKNLDVSDKAKTVEHGIEVLKQYVAYYKNQDQVWEVLATELEGDIEIGDDGGHGLHIDLVAKHKQTGEIYFWDHKTTGKEPYPSYWKTYDISAQVTRYTAYVKDKFGECGGCYINNIAIKHLLRKNKYGDGPGLVVKFERQLFNRTPQQVEFWRKSDSDWMKLILYCEVNGVWPKALGGLCSYCEFYDLCIASGDSTIKELLYNNKEDEFNVEIE